MTQLKSVKGNLDKDIVNQKVNTEVEEAPIASGAEIGSAPLLEESRECVQPNTTVDNFFSPHNQDFYSSFKYTNLDREKREIRLLRIIMDGGELDNTSPIACEMSENLALKDAQDKFIALSYCAGNPKETETIVVNGIKFNAFARLGHGLRQARYYWKTHGDNGDLLIWADQICINQSVPEERSHQVNFMGDVYGAAKITLISLSDDNSSSGGLGWIMSSYDDSSSEGNGERLRKLFESSLHDERLHYGLDCFIRTVLQSPYWKRAWVRQEYARSHRSILMAFFEFCGGQTFGKLLGCYFHFLERSEIDTPNVQSFKDWLAKEPQYCPIKLDDDECMACQPYYNLGDHYTKFESTQDLFVTKALGTDNLIEHIQRGGSTVASDPRDRIFAFLGLSSITFGITANYSPLVSVEDVLCQLACQAINHDGHLSALMGPKKYPASKYPRDLPSWVPDWIAPHNYLRNDIYLLASRNEFTRSQCVARFLPDDSGRQYRILQVRGGIASDLLEFHDLPIEPEPWRDPQNRIEMWWIYGLKVWCGLRRRGKYYEIIGFAGRKYFKCITHTKRFMWNIGPYILGPDYEHAKFDTMVESGHPGIRTINIS